MIHAVFCASADEKNAAIAWYKGLNPPMQVTWFGPDAVVQPEKFNGQAIAVCADCAVGPNGFLVVAYPPGEGPFPG